MESTVIVRFVNSPVTTTAIRDFLPALRTNSAALAFPAESNAKLNPSESTTANDFVFKPGSAIPDFLVLIPIDSG